MKILDAQNAVLTNYEVYQHLMDQQKRYEKMGKRKRNIPPNLNTIVEEVLRYLQQSPAPLSQKPITYDPTVIAQLIERFRPYDISKGEMVMIINLRPDSIPVLTSCIEDITERFWPEQQTEMLNIIAEVLGQFPQEEEAEPVDGGNEVDMVQSIEGGAS